MVILALRLTESSLCRRVVKTLKLYVGKCVGRVVAEDSGYGDVFVSGKNQALSCEIRVC